MNRLVPYRTAVERVMDELAEVLSKQRPFASLHEGFAVLAEEVDELWELVRERSPASYDIAKEARQVAAMAVRIMVECAAVKEVSVPLQCVLSEDQK